MIKAEFSPLVVGEEVRFLKHEGDVTYQCWLEDGDKECGYLRELREVSGRQPAMKRGPQFYNHKDLNSADNLNESGSGFPLSLQSRTQPN